MKKKQTPKDQLNDTEAPEEKKRLSVPEEEIPSPARAFLGPDNLHLFKRDHVSAVLPQGRPAGDSDSDSDEDES